MGNFESEVYFASIADQIRQEFAWAVLPELNTGERNLLSEIENENSIAVHVRRGDKVSEARWRAIFTVPERVWYQAAADRLQSGDNIRWFVFSDEPHWARHHLDFLPNARFVEHHGADAQIKDFHLMSQCKHFIISNSSFSWWAAWLSKYGTKQVIAPSPWFASKDFAAKEERICPLDWIRIPLAAVSAHSNSTG